jgi:hypothetical protein
MIEPYWNQIAQKQFESLDEDAQMDWKDLRDLVQHRH